jgi:hypothetical protein
VTEYQYPSNCSKEHGLQKNQTFLNELEAIDNVTLIGHEQESAVMSSFLTVFFLGSNLRTELNAATENAASFCATECGKVIPRVCLAGVRCEGASDLAEGVISESIVSGWIGSKYGIIRFVRDINWCS